MSYIKNNLLAEEQLIHCTKPHYVIFFRPLGWIALVVWLYAWGKLLGLELFAYRALLLVWFLVLGWNVLDIVVSYYYSEYAITSQRTVMKVGFVQRKSLELFLKRIEGVHLEQGILGRLLDFGTIVIVGTGGTKSYFNQVPKPLQFMNSLQTQLRTRKESGTNN